MQIVRLQTGDEDVVLAGAELFDRTPTRAWTAGFLSGAGHHLLVALAEDRRPLGFVSGIETTHPDKGTEMLVYELSVHSHHRNHGIGRALVKALGELARQKGCYGMWVATERENVAALATYRAAGADEPEDCVVLSWTFDPPPAAPTAPPEPDAS